MAYRNYAPENGFIVDKAGNGDFTTIAAALTAATSGKTIWINPGTYTENPTLKAGVNLVSSDADRTTPNVTISGKCTATFAGTCSISGINLQTNSDFFLAVTGSNATVVNLNNCQLNATNNTGISFTSSNAGAVINIQWTTGGLSTTGIAYFAHSSAGLLAYYHCQMSNSGSSSTASTCSAGTLSTRYSSFNAPITTSGTATITSIHNVMATSNSNSTCLTLGGSGGQTIFGGSFTSGTASAISVGSASTIDTCEVSSSNTNAITGASTLTHGVITYPGSSSGNNVTTKVGLQTDIGTFGTWTPVLTFGGASVGITYSSQFGYYKRIGDVVYFGLSILLTSKGSSVGAAGISGLPFTSSSTSQRGSIAVNLFSFLNISPYTTTYSQVTNSSTVMTLGISGQNVANAALQDSHFANNSAANFSGFYFVS